MGATSEVEQEERRRKPWMQIKVRGGGGFLVLGGALIAAGLGAAFAAHRARVNNKRSSTSPTTKPVDEACKGISCNGEGGRQLDEVEGDPARGLAALLALDSTPTVKLAEDWQAEISDDIPVETQENIVQAMIEKSLSFKHLEVSVATDGRIVETDAAEFSLGRSESGMVENQKEQSSEESEPVNLKELKEEEFSFSVVEFTEIQDKNNQNLEGSELDRVRDKEEGEDGEAPSAEEEEEFSFRSVESDTMQNQTKWTLEKSKMTHAREQEGGGGGGESNDDVEAPSSESQEDETESSAKGESEIEEEESDGTGDSSIEPSAEAVWPAEIIEQEKISLFLENHQEIIEESCEEKVTAVQTEREIEEQGEKSEKKVAAAEESVSIAKKMGAGPKTMKRETKIGLMPVNYSNRILLLLLGLALALTLISFAHHDHLHGFCLAKLYHHLHQLFFPSNNAM